MNQKINEDITYDEIKDQLRNAEDKRYADFILEKEDIKIEFGYLIFDVENKDKNKTLDAISYCKNLGNDYVNTCLWLVENTQYYPGLMRLDVKLLIKDTKQKFLLMVNKPKDNDYIVGFDYVENKEDGILLATTLKYNQHELKAKNLYAAYMDYFNKDEVLKQYEMYINETKEALNRLEFNFK